MLLKFFKKRKKTKGQAVVEMICCLGLYFFLIGFMITGFQLMHNKMVYSLAAYEGVRTAVAYNTSTRNYDIAGGYQRAMDVVVNQIGDTNGNVDVDFTVSGNYITCTVRGDVKYLFPMISPNTLTSETNSIVQTQFTMRKERP